MIRPSPPGAPMPYGSAAFQPELILSAGGDYDAGAGTRIAIQDGCIVFLASFDGTNIMQGVPISVILEGIAEYTRGKES